MKGGRPAGLPIQLLSVFAWTGVGLLTFFWTAAIAGIYALHPLIDPQLKAAHRAASWWGRGLVRMAPGARVHLTGAQNIPPGKAVIFMANHQSYVDVPLLFYVPGQFKWMADEGLFGIPVFGWAMRMAGYVRVRRGDARAAVQSLHQAKKLLADGISVFIFPEGTRSRTGVFARFQSGGFRLSQETGAPIVPVIVSGTRQLLPRGSWAFRWGVGLWIDVLPAVPAPASRDQVRPLASKLRTQMWAAYGRRVKSLADHVRITA